MSEGSERKNAACYECDFEPLLLLDLQDSRSAPHEAVGGSGCISHSAVSLCIDLTVSQGLDSTQLMNLCKNYVSLFFICFFFFSNLKKKKKASKTRKDMQGIHEGIGAKLLPTLLAAAPPPPPLLYPCATVSAPATSSAACALCTVLYSPSPCAFCFFFYLFIFLILPYTETQSQPKVLFFFFFLSQREVISNY